MGEATPFRDAEAFLRELGIEPEPITVDPFPEPSAPASPPAAADRATAHGGDGGDGGDGGEDAVGEVTEDAPPADDPAAADLLARAARPLSDPELDDEPGATRSTAAAAGTSERAEGSAPSARDVGRLAGQAAADAAQRQGDADALPDPGSSSLESDIAQAVAFVRNSTAAAPQSEARLRGKLFERGSSAVVVEHALDRARRERLIDDVALAAALVEERRAKGHAPARLRRDLRDRGFTDEVLDRVLERAEAEDPEAAAFAIATSRAARLTALPADTAFRRIVGYLARRGYPEGLARKVAREAVFSTRDDQRIAGR
ncbi:MAG: RecX family transcriptional regulator [Nitriliruptoraceae bacterium]|nr:RecX family transcriptional regulator [Nitriliruptoraceae bacterium]